MVYFGEEATGSLRHARASGCRTYTPTRALKQRNTKLSFEVTDPATKCGLLNVEGCCRLPKAPVLSGRDNAPQRTQIEIHNRTVCCDG